MIRRPAKREHNSECASGRIVASRLGWVERYRIETSIPLPVIIIVPSEDDPTSSSTACKSHTTLHLRHSPHLLLWAQLRISASPLYSTPQYAEQDSGSLSIASNFCQAGEYDTPRRSSSIQAEDDPRVYPENAFSFSYRRCTNKNRYQYLLHNTIKSAYVVRWDALAHRYTKVDPRPTSIKYCKKAINEAASRASTMKPNTRKRISLGVFWKPRTPRDSGTPRDSV
ncbi:hypothetical protein B0H12DRAFT_1223793 [Mycena haematopus]|nr:hypothetical protein B0H12DRAFT_1223793 [Mycena haematopus]